MIYCISKGESQLDIKQALTDLFKKDESILLVILYGSFAAGRETPNSDIDIAVAGKEKRGHEQLADLNLRLSKLTGREVDIIDLNNTEGTILTEVITKGTVLKKQDTDLYADLIKKVIYYEEDMAKNIRYILKYRQEKFLNAL